MKEINVLQGDEEGLDRTKIYLRPVARLDLPGEPDHTHMSTYTWLKPFQSWATGPAICGYSTSQGPLPEDTAVTCPRCQELIPIHMDRLNKVNGGYEFPGQELPERTLRKFHLEAEELNGEWVGLIGGKDNLPEVEHQLSYKKQRFPERDMRVVEILTIHRVIREIPGKKE